MKVRCPLPNHVDDTPSCEVYEHSAYCFVCNEVVPLLMLGLSKGPADKLPEDLTVKLEYIKSLPTEVIRGITFPVDKIGYYIVWPDEKYYKRRNFEGPRYTSPSGHQEPVFWARQGSCKDVLWVVEGQINALSLVKVVKSDVVSPGGTGNFNYRFSLPTIKEYGNVVIVTDGDGVGVKASQELKGCILAAHPYVSIITTGKPSKTGKEDVNFVLVKSGEEGVRKYVKERLCTLL